MAEVAGRGVGDPARPVSGTLGGQKHKGNAVVADPAHPEILTANSKDVSTLGYWFEPSGYLAQVSDVAISGVGHCGSSSPWSIHDAVNLERAGCPTVALISRSFCPLAQIVAKGVGYPALPIVLLPHPIGEADTIKISAKGSDAAAECVRFLTSASATVAGEFVAKTFPLPEHAVARA